MGFLINESTIETSSKNVISIDNFSRRYLEELFCEADKMKFLPRKEKQRILENKTIACLFFEPSTRTKLSFETAIKNLGGQTIGFSSADESSTKKGESLQDTIRVVSSYADGIIMRHYDDFAARNATLFTNKTIINAGDGKNEHPTQTFLDLYTIQEQLGKIDGLTIGIIGDLKYGRTTHSLVKGLNKFENIKVYLIAPNELQFPEKIIKETKNISFLKTDSVKKVLPELDVLYVTRIQKERFEDEKEYEKLKDSFIINKKILEQTKDHLKIMHPLPRVNEIAIDVDQTKNAIYFKQAENGLYIREALLKILFNPR